MTKFKKIVSSPVFSVAALLAAAGLLVFSSISGARAALNIESDDYYAHVELYDIGVQLNEKNEGETAARRVAWRDYNNEVADGTWDETPGTDHVGKLCEKLLGEDKQLKPGKAYKEELSVTNSGTINEFVRVTVYKYWIDENGNKTQELDPALIDLHLTPGDSWILDQGSSTAERTVLYYNKLLNADVTTPNFADTLTIDSKVTDIMTEKAVTTEKSTEVRKDGNTYTTFVTTYAYNGYQFVLEAAVDAVQEHNAQAAVKSAWGKNVVISGTSLSLQQ